MSFLDRLLPKRESVRLEPTFEVAGTKLPEPPPIKAPNKQQTYPGYRTTTKPSKSPITRTDLRLASSEITAFRSGNSSNAVIKNLVASSPDLGASVSSMLRVGIPEEYTVIGRNLDGSVNVEATQTAHELLRRFTFVSDYSQGFNPQVSLQALSESLGKELIQYGSAALEVSLDKSRLPVRMTPVSTTSLIWYEDANDLKPVQKVGGDEINLDIPTFVYTELDQDLLEAYSQSFIQTAIQPTLADADFMQDLRRVLKRSVQPRLVATILEEKARKTFPPEILNDPDKFAAGLNALVAAVENTVNNAAVEDAFVTFDAIEYDYIQNPGDVSGTLKAVQDVLNSKLSAGAKTLPSVLGHGEGGSAASTEALLYLKTADAVRRHLNTLYSRALTVSVRLFGIDCYIEFRYSDLDLRPKAELEAFKSMEQSRVLDLLSLGMIGDEEACIRLTGNLPGPMYKPLSGTGFRTPMAVSDGAQANPTSNTSSIEQNMTPKTPQSPKSPRKA